MEDPAPTPDPASASVRISPSARRLAFAGAAVLILWVALQFVPQPAFSPPKPEQPAPPQSAPAPTPLLAAPVPPTPADTSAERLQVLEEKIDRLAEQATAPPAQMDALGAQVTEQARAIAELKEKQEKSARRLARAEAYDVLKERVMSGAPYAAELSQLQLLTQNEGVFAEPLAALEETSQSGIPTVEMLKDSFTRTVKTVLTPHAAPGAGMWERLSANLASLIVIRRVGDIPGDSPEAAIARAEAALERGNVAATLHEVEPLENFRAWSATARAYVGEKEHLAALRRAIFAADE